MYSLLPYYYVIEPTNICNFKCGICPHSIEWEKREQGMMEMSLFRHILDQISDTAKVIQLYWMGEPLLHKNIIQMISLAKEQSNAKVIISTNGSMLTPDLSDNLIRSGLDELVVSVDACESQQIYGAIRVGGCLENLNNNIQYLLLHKKNMDVVLQFIDMYINKSEMMLFLDKWKSYDCKIEISCLYTWSNQIPALNYASDNLSPVIKKKRIPCADLWNKMCIHWNGEVSACCFDYDNKLPLGNCKKTSLMQLWNGDRVNQLREQQMCGIYDKRLCKQCDAWAEPDEYFDMYHINGENI